MLEEERGVAAAVNIDSTWKTILQDEWESPPMKELKDFLRSEREQGFDVFPPKHLIFNAFNHTPYDRVKVVIVGQDPYHGPGQAHGLSFSVEKGVRLPPSLRNIFKEVSADVGPFTTNHGSLVSWADQGVFLLNAILTVRCRQPASHQNQGWEMFTDAVLQKLNTREKPMVFMLWGKYAQQKGQWLDASKHLILKAPHPSPFSAHTGFFGCRHFSKANQFLEKTGQAPINWRLLD